MSETFLHQARGLIDTPEPPGLGPERRAGVLSVTEINSRLDRIAADSGGKEAGRALLRALILLWHDHLDASHRVSQEIDGADGSYVHGMMHRREPDYGNAKYWFRKVGDHRCFAALAERAGPALQGHALAGSLVRGGQWDPFRFIDECEAREGRDDEGAALLRRIQALEFGVLLEEFSSSLYGS